MLRSQMSEKDQHNSSSLGPDADRLGGNARPDPSCKRGVISKDFKACCTDDCGICGSHPLCGDPGKFHEATGKLANNCCKDRILAKAPSCEKDHPPCILSDSYRQALTKWEFTMPDRHAMQDCNKSLKRAMANHARGIDKGEFLARLYLEGETKYKKAKEIALDVDEKCDKRIAEAEQEVADQKAHIAKASKKDKVEDQLTGVSNLKKWQDAVEHAEAEVKFYKMIIGNAEKVADDASKGLTNVAALRKKVKDANDIEPLQIKLEALVDDAEKVHKDALLLWQQWRDSSKSYDCGVPPAVQNAKVQCTSGNTKYSPKCHIECAEGYDGEGTRNMLRCAKTGKFGKTLYGEWQGMAVCAGARCGIPPNVMNSIRLAHVVRYPDVATYRCVRGFFTSKGDHGFSLPCGTAGHFAANAMESCKGISCGEAPQLQSTLPVKGTYHYTESVTYTCQKGYTIDEVPGGLQHFATHCQATGKFTTGVGCHPIRCGPAPDFQHTKVVAGSHVKKDKHISSLDHYHDDELHFGDQIDFQCDEGYTTDTTIRGARKYTLECFESGDLVLAGTDGHHSHPTCQPICAGTPDPVENGEFNPTKLCYGDSLVVNANVGYSLSGKAGVDLSFHISVDKHGHFVGRQKFLPVDCGSPPEVKKAKTKFGAETASFGDVVRYSCEPGYSLDAPGVTGDVGSEFSISCEADGDFSKVPGVGECVNIDDCLGHTCGPHGVCKDHLMNYTCDCKPGYSQQWDPRSGELHCGNIDDCGPEACGVGTCIDLVGDYKCDCPSGYQQVLESNGNRSDKTCAAITCGRPPRVGDAFTEPTHLQGAKAFYGEVIRYQCEEGHTVDGGAGGQNHFEIECLASKKFSDPKECKRIKCESPPDLKHATTKAKDAKFGEGIKYECAKGHTVAGAESGITSFEVSCLVSGAFSEPQICEPIVCGDPVHVPNSFYHADTLSYGDKVEYSCLAGFSLDGEKNGKDKFEVECKEDGTLTEPKRCEAKKCGVPLPHAVSYADVKDEGIVRYPMSTEVHCQDGYTVDGDPNGNKSFVVRCLAGGEFDEYNAKTCQPVRCGKATSSGPNSTLVEARNAKGQKIGTTDDLVYHEYVWYQCAPGFTTGGEHDAPKEYMVECSDTGHFAPPPEDMLCKNVNDCEGHTCGPKGVCVDLIGPSPAYTCKCEKGYEMREENGEKVCGNKDDCKGNDCGVGTCEDLVDDYTCSCPSGYYQGFKDGKKTCVPVSCADMAPVPNHTKLVSNHKGKVEFPTTLKYECDKGHSIDGTVTAGKAKFQAQCRNDGIFHGMMKCARINCGGAQFVPFTTLIHPTAEEDHAIHYGEKAEYECFEGYTIKGKPDGETKFDVKCPEDGHLTEPEVCEPVRCGEAPEFNKARSSITGDVSFGQRVTYVCDVGYTMGGTFDGDIKFNVDCLKTGKFSKPEVDDPCQPIFATPPKMQDANLTIYKGKKVDKDKIPERVEYPHALVYTCKEGYSLSGSPAAPTFFSTKVDAIGAFSPPVPARCHKIKFDIRGMVKDARTGKMLTDATVYIDNTAFKSFAGEGFFGLQGVPGGATKIRYQRDGYITGERELNVTGNIASGGLADMSLSPIMDDTSWRAVLKWGEEPEDLDAYVKFGANKVWWQNLHQASEHLAAQLEHDDTTSYGPETTHMSGVGKCEGGAYFCDIRYYVNDYTETGKMPELPADVTLYTGDRVAGQWHIKDCPSAVSDDKMWWHVFTLDGATNELKWSCLDGKSPAPELFSHFLLKNVTQSAPPRKKLRARV